MQFQLELTHEDLDRLCPQLGSRYSLCSDILHYKYSPGVWEPGQFLFVGIKACSGDEQPLVIRTSITARHHSLCWYGKLSQHGATHRIPASDISTKKPTNPQVAPIIPACTTGIAKGIVCCIYSRPALLGCQSPREARCIERCRLSLRGSHCRTSVRSRRPILIHLGC